jgi:hypothetical protein
MLASDQITPALYQKIEYLVHTILRISSFRNDRLSGEDDFIRPKPTLVLQGHSLEDIVDVVGKGIVR